MRFGTGQLPVWRPIQPVNCKILIEIQEHPIKTRIPVAQQQFPFIINSTARVRVNVLFYILPTHTFPFCGSHQHQQCTHPSEVLIGPSSTYISMRISVQLYIFVIQQSGPFGYSIFWRHIYTIYLWQTETSKALC